jgi:hypothetical protein
VFRLEDFLIIRLPRTARLTEVWSTQYFTGSGRSDHTAPVEDAQRFLDWGISCTLTIAQRQVYCLADGAALGRRRPKCCERGNGRQKYAHLFPP